MKVMEKSSLWNEKGETKGLDFSPQKQGACCLEHI